MSRSPLLLREATPADVPKLRDVLATLPTQENGVDGVDDAAMAVARIAAAPDQRLLVADYPDEGDVAGALLLVSAPLTPLHLESAVHVLHLYVREDARRHGIGRALMEAAVSWAEERGTTHVLAAATVGSRDGNRFLARLGFSQAAMLRATTVPALRARFPLEAPAAARMGGRSHRNVGQVIARRRSLRRAQERLS